MPPSEATPLLSESTNGFTEHEQHSTDTKTTRERIFDFIEAKTPAGLVYEQFTILLILLSIASFILGTLFVEEYNDADWAKRQTGICQDWCDSLFFGNYSDNMLQNLNLGTTSVLEIVTVAVFSIDYLTRLWTADLEAPIYQGFLGRLRYLPSFYSLVDLASTVPFYLDAFLPSLDLGASQFLRMFRLFRMMRVGKYAVALSMFDDVFLAQRGILGTALFVGVTTWATVSSLYYIVERESLAMIYCGAAPDYCGSGDEIDTSLCTIDEWGFVDCSMAGCPPTEDYPEPCYNLYRSIPMASYYSLLNLFGEFPLIDQHGLWGKVVGTLVAVVAVAVFALPAGIIGNGFEDLIANRTQAEAANNQATEEEQDDENRLVVGNDETSRGRWYNFLHAQTSHGAVAFDQFINLLVLVTALTFMLDTVNASWVTPSLHFSFDIIEFFAVVVFTVEYVLRVYSAAEDPKYQGLGGHFTFMGRFVPLVDILSVLPYWLDVIVTGTILSGYGDESDFWSTLVKCLRLLRLLRFEKYTHAFTSFDEVIARNVDVLAVTGFAALIMWVFFGAVLYFTERDNPDPEMRSYYNTVPNAMWITLLNLSGESPLCQYTIWGKITTGVIGLFATGLFGIPIGVLGAGFEELVGEENKDTPDDEEQAATSSGEIEISEGASHAEALTVGNRSGDDEEASVVGTGSELWAYMFVNGEGSTPALYFELCIYALIVLSVFVGIIQTVSGLEDFWYSVEVFAIAVFTVEYLLRFFGAGADPEFRKSGRSGFEARLRFVFSFYSIIDLLAILPYYAALAMPGSWVDAHDEYLRMFRLLRLIKLDKYIPSITLIDDVLRLKKNALVVAGFAAVTLWILFASLIYLTEHNDHVNEIDNVPSYGCGSDCTMSDRFQNFFDSMVYTGVHLTGDYPIITYSWPARFLCFFMVIAAVGVVSVPSGLIASGFAEIVQSKAKRRSGEGTATGVAGDDWYEISLRQLSNQAPPLSRFGPKVDEWQIAVNEYLNGKEVNGKAEYTAFARFGRIFIFTVIIANIVAVLLESVPEIDKKVGDHAGNFFDVFEMISVMIFALEYILRLFCAPKNKEALYSSFVYATTFFGIVDLLSTAPWFVEQALMAAGMIGENGDAAKIFRMFRMFRILQLEDFVVAFSKLDNVFRASGSVLKATGLMAAIIWVGCGALFFIFEENNPNWRECDMSIPAFSDEADYPGCYNFSSTAACNDFYGEDMCTQRAFTSVPDALYFTAVFLVGEWGLVDFTWPGRFVCLFLCVVGIALYAIPVGTLFDSFGAVLGMVEDEEEEEEEE